MVIAVDSALFFTATILHGIVCQLSPLHAKVLNLPAIIE
jgi:hypothetical protein